MKDISRVMEGGYCIGCGACPFVDPSISMVMDDDGKYQAKPGASEPSDKANACCPFANAQLNEDVLGKRLFGSIDGIQHKSATGYYLENYAGYVTADGYRDRGSSGGMVSWLAAKLLEIGKVDAVLHVKPAEDESVMYEYRVSTSVEELKEGAKSKYYPIELSEVLQYVAEHDGRYAVIGIPCFIKAMRLVEQEDEVIAARVRYHLGLVCGHLKSTFFALSEAWESGIPLQDIRMVDFRYKLPGRKATDYGIQATGVVDGKTVTVTKPTRELSTTNWGYGYFKYNACEYCDDVLAETADITCGDAWLPQYAKDGQGTNVVVVRSLEMKELLEHFADEIHLEAISADVVAQSQGSGLRHRREGTSYRLYLKDQAGEWRPTKRVKPSNRIPHWRKAVYKERLELVRQSFIGFHLAERSPQGMQAFNEHMAPYLKRYKRADNPWYRRVGKKAKQLVRRVLGK